MKFWRRNWTWITLVLIVFLVYANVYSFQFLYDDEFLIQHNTLLRSLSGLWRSFLTSSTGGSGGADNFYRPLQGALYTVVFTLFGLSTAAFHVLNIALHAANAVLIWTLGRRLGFSPRAAWIGAVIWAVHPLHTEAVTYMSATADPLYTFFVLLGLLLIAPAFKARDLALACLIFLLGLLSKEAAIVFPALAVVVRGYLLPPERRWHWRPYLVTLPFWLLAAAYLLARKTFLNFDNTFDFYKTANVYTENWWVRLYTFMATLPSYLELLFWPHGQHMDRAFPVFVNFWLAPVLIGAVILTIAALVCGWEAATGRSKRSLVIFWFAAAHVPHTGVLLPVNSFFLEHWMYLPSIALFWAIGHTLATRVPAKIGSALTAVIVLSLSVATWKQNKVWADPITFYENILSYGPRVARVQNNLAMAYSDAGRDDDAIQHYQEAIRLEDIYPQTHHNLALAYLRQGKVAEARAEFERALRLKPDFFPSLHALAELSRQLGDLNKAKEYEERYQEAISKFR
jgi:tetratricopeptide (TPR) repeat protein